MNGRGAGSSFQRLEARAGLALEVSLAAVKCTLVSRDISRARCVEGEVNSLLDKG
jgi:hypothetical protein